MKKRATLAHDDYIPLCNTSFAFGRQYAVQHVQDELALRLLSECFEDEVFHIEAVVEEMASAHSRGCAYSISESAFASIRAFDALYFSAIAAGFSPYVYRDVMTVYPEVG